MKKLYRRGSVHPSPPIISDHLSFLPATILTLTAALSPEDREVLAYLLSCSNSSVNLDGRRRTTHHKGGADHPPQFNCNCFRCYTSYWVRWDSSPNRQAIHEIIDAFEAELMAHGKKSGKSRKERRKRGCHNGSAELKRLEASSAKDESSETDSLGGESGNSLHDDAGGGDGEDGFEKGSVRRFVSFIGERIWGVWSQ
ncbi:uncharacterized protein LOC121268281 [Juglans microcarpa x Juglans regia]|uniref:uncharacterized protein LOC121268281 n=1 Tax=Juglans microcarpa x Juglans regia TaxID=2249226 RepID=UPI001B7F655B|nr:uncharacterized protein LOC121268281 [Juglans microcarpa x Juglans regia]